MARALIVLLLLALARPARADELQEGWYGYQTALVDLAALALVSGGERTRPPALGGLFIAAGLATYAIGPAILHGAGHHNGSAASP
jgi:hypothetical protein